MMRLRPLYVVLIVVAVLLLAGIAWLSSTARRFEADIVDIEVGTVDLRQVRDGTYAGAHAAGGIVKAEVRVTVDSGRITEIELVRHEHGRGQDAQELPGRVVAAQSLAVELVSGATYSSKVILKAIENALLGK